MLPLHPVQYEIAKEQVRAKGIIRDLTKADIAQLLAVDFECFNPKLTEKDLLLYFKYQPPPVTTCKVVDVNKRIIAFHLYQTFPDRIDIIRLGVDPSFRRKGIATRLVKEAYRKLTLTRNQLTCPISEYADDAIAFLSSPAVGFKAVGVIKKGCPDDTDAYDFRLVLQEAKTL